MKKRILTGLLIGVSSVIIGLCPEVALAESKPMTYITGYVLTRWDDPFDVTGLKVQVSCLDMFTGEYYGGGEDIVGADGGYLIILPAEKCPAESRLLGGAGDDEDLHYGHGRNFGDRVINSKLILYEGDIGMLW